MSCRWLLTHFSSGWSLSAMMGPVWPCSWNACFTCRMSHRVEYSRRITLPNKRPHNLPSNPLFLLCRPSTLWRPRLALYKFYASAYAYRGTGSATTLYLPLRQDLPASQCSSSVIINTCCMVQRRRNYNSAGLPRSSPQWRNPRGNRLSCRIYNKEDMSKPVIG
jgi:hypothetical protein